MNKKNRKSFSKCLFFAMVLGILVLCFSIAAAASSGECGNNLTFTLDDNGLLTITGTGEMWDSYEISWGGTIHQIKLNPGITSIGSHAFYGCDITSITIPSGVTNIGAAAFRGCSSLSSVSLPDGLTTIEGSAFYGCSSLTSITIPDSLTRVEYQAFYECPAILYATLGSDGAKALGRREYPFRISGTKFDLRYYLDEDDTVRALIVVSADSDATEIELPYSVTEIGPSSFSECSQLKSITFPDSVTHVENSAFWGCPAVMYATLGSDSAKALSRAGYSFHTSGSSCGLKYYFDDEESITGLAVTSGDQEAAEIVVPSGVTIIGDSAFQEYSKLTSITIPDSVISIERLAFLRCSSLTTVNIPDSVTSIGNFAFSDCTALKSITIPDGVTVIEENAFNHCRALRYAKIGSEGAKALCRAGYTFRVDGCKGDLLYYFHSSRDDDLTLESVDLDATEIVVPPEVTSFYSWKYDHDTPFYIGNNLKRITMNSRISDIDFVRLFRDCAKLESITIPSDHSAYSSVDGVVYNKKKTVLIYCPIRKAGNITIPKGVTGIGEGIFSDRAVLTGITIPASVTEIGNNAFVGCTALKTVTGGTAVKTIGASAFENCKNLTSVPVMKKVTKIGNSAFQKTGLTKFTIGAKVTDIGMNTFASCTKLQKVEGGKGVTAIRDSAFSGCAKLSAVPAFEKLQTIGANAFKGCKALSKITLSAKIYSIGKNAFNKCAKLKTIVIKTKLLTNSNVGAAAFKGIAGKPTVTCPKGMAKTYKTLLRKKGMPKKAVFK